MPLMMLRGGCWLVRVGVQMMIMMIKTAIEYLIQILILEMKWKNFVFLYFSIVVAIVIVIVGSSILRISISISRPSGPIF